LTGPGQPGGTRPHPAHDSPATPRQAAQRADTATRPGQRGCDLPQLAWPSDLWSRACGRLCQVFRRRGAGGRGWRSRRRGG
jgi:hypothetical protein